MLKSHIYKEALQHLDHKGLIYPCWCTRAQRLAASAPHPGESRGDGACPCKQLSREERAVRLAESQRPPALRAAVPDENISFTDGHLGEYFENLRRDCGDFLVRRSDGVCAYQLAVSVDDALMGITRVIRGKDLLASTPRQIWLHRSLGFAPPKYFHTPLLLAEDGRRLSKREKDMDMGALRERFSSNELSGYLAFLAGIIPESVPVSPQELIKLFSWDKILKTDIYLK